MIIKWAASTTWGDVPTKKEYDRETEHYYVKANKQRDSKISRYERYFDGEAEAIQFIADRNATRKRNKEIDQIRRHAVELLEALVALQTAAYNIGGEHVIGYRQLIDVADSADEIIAKAKGQTE